MSGVAGGHKKEGSATSPLAARQEDFSFVQEAPPTAVGQSERRMQVRAYTHWAKLLGNRALPPLACLDSGELADFAAHGVIIDMASTYNGCSLASETEAPSPAIRFIGARLAEDCNASTLAPITTVRDVPEGSLLSRLTSHCAQILSNNAPLSFEGEFANSRNVTIQYRGILLPFSDDDSRVEQVFGVISWREVAGDSLTQSLHKEVNAALQSIPAV